MNTYETARARLDRITEALDLAVQDHKATAKPLVDWRFIDALNDARDDVEAAFEQRRADTAVLA